MNGKRFLETFNGNQKEPEKREKNKSNVGQR
jgi:hypothetical protein